VECRYGRSECGFAGHLNGEFGAGSGLSLWLAVNKVILDDLLSNSAFVPWLGWHAAPVLLLLITIFAYVAFEIAWVMNGKAEPLPTTK